MSGLRISDKCIAAAGVSKKYIGWIHK
jgi:hypothetical protein